MGFDYFPPPYDTKKTPKENMKSLHDYDRQHKKSTVYTGLIFILSVVLLTIAMMLFAMIKFTRIVNMNDRRAMIIMNDWCDREKQ